MTTPGANETVIAALDRVAQNTFAWFDGAGRTTAARVDRWQARDVLQHFIYFHDATAWGIQSAALGGPVWPLPADSDHINEVWRLLHEPESVDDLLTQLKLAHGRLMRAARSSPDLDRPCFRRATGETMTGRQRIELLAKHWAEQVDELKKAGAGR